MTSTQDADLDFAISRLGECRVPSPMQGVRFVRDDEQVLYHGDAQAAAAVVRAGKPLPHFEMAGPRERIYFDPSALTCGIVTCGGLCPGLNDVIRSIVLSLHHHYGVPTVLGFRYGYEGLIPRYGHEPMALTPGTVIDIHQRGGTILGSSRGPQAVGEMVDTLERRNVGVLFTLGGDGTLRGARAIAEEIGRRGLRIGVVGIPKTIDNDVSYVQQTFGFATAVSEASRAIYSAHIEAEGARNGIGLVKLMGRHSGFIAAYATLANSDVNFCLVPEVRFTLDALCRAVRQRLERRRHAVVVVAEGAGQELLQATAARDASGNVRLGDIGVFLRDRISDYMREAGLEASLKYIDPSYAIRSMPANAHDSAFCLMLGHNAVHAALAGRTDMAVGNWRGEFTNLPIAAAVSQRRQIDPTGRLWTGVISTTGQPRELV
ncbi:MAG: ATP-dependent 6-phosphofructokinase [Gemmatimonadota bacterium]|nr:ATP-dependent 6-phosphofructokinase [Gemmatimonadota bacterium]MDH5198198.1 ATP-dependent 6-phosphofructokinase [Gemmatimonadota bacterium]